MTMMSSADYSRNAQRAEILPKGASAGMSALAAIIVFAPLSLMGLSFLIGGKPVANLMFFMVANLLLAVPILAGLLALCAAAVAMKQIFFLSKSSSAQGAVSRPASAFRGPYVNMR